MLIYVITQGDYSDYHIITATTDVDKAYAIAKEMTDAEVETYDSENFQVAPTGRHGYVVRFYGDEVIVRQAKDDYDYNTCLKNNFWFDSYGNVTCAFIMARDEEHAKKICYDASAKKKAELMNL